MSPLTQQYLDTTLHLVKQIKGVANFNRSADFDKLNNTLSQLWRYMTDEERDYVAAQLKV